MEGITSKLVICACQLMVGMRQNVDDWRKVLIYIRKKIRAQLINATLA
jgi:hypothetical protein